MGNRRAGYAVSLGNYDVAVMIAIFTMLTLRLLSKQKSALKQCGQAESGSD